MQAVETLVTGAQAIVDGPHTLERVERAADVVRARFGTRPDVAIILRSRLPRGEMPRDPICPVAPDLAIEILSPGNTRKELARKLQTYFDSGVRIAWVVIPPKRLVRVYTSATDFSELGEDDTLDGGEILPGFRLSIREWFEAAR